MRLHILLAVTALLNACSGSGFPGASGPGAQAPIVRYVPGDDAIEVVSESRAIRDVQIVGPRGSLAASVSINQRDASQPGYGGYGGYGVPGVSLGFGAGRISGGVASAVFLVLPLLIPSPVPAYGAAPGAAGTSTARATLDEPRRYGREWQRSRVRVTFADGASEDYAAPAPN